MKLAALWTLLKSLAPVIAAVLSALAGQQFQVARELPEAPSGSDQFVSIWLPLIGAVVAALCGGIPPWLRGDKTTAKQEAGDLIQAVITATTSLAAKDPSNAKLRDISKLVGPLVEKLIDAAIDNVKPPVLPQ